MAFHIHYEDPGFPDPPWPGERVIPAATLEDAVAQAVSDAARGYGTPLGIYEDTASLAGAGGPDPETGAPLPTRKGAAAYTRSQIERRADTVRRRLAAEQVQMVEDQRAMVDAVLPKGVKWSELQALADTIRQAQAQAAEEQP